MGIPIWKEEKPSISRTSTNTISKSRTRDSHVHYDPTWFNRYTASVETAASRRGSNNRSSTWSNLYGESGPAQVSQRDRYRSISELFGSTLRRSNAIRLNGHRRMAQDIGERRTTSLSRWRDSTRSISPRTRPSEWTDLFSLRGDIDNSEQTLPSFETFLHDSHDRETSLHGDDYDPSHPLIERWADHWRRRLADRDVLDIDVRPQEHPLRQEHRSEHHGQQESDTTSYNSIPHVATSRLPRMRRRPQVHFTNPIEQPIDIFGEDTTNPLAEGDIAGNEDYPNPSPREDEEIIITRLLDWDDETHPELPPVRTIIRPLTREIEGINLNLSRQTRELDEIRLQEDLRELDLERQGGGDDIDVFLRRPGTTLESPIINDHHSFGRRGVTVTWSSDEDDEDDCPSSRYRFPTSARRHEQRDRLQR